MKFIIFFIALSVCAVGWAKEWRGDDGNNWSSSEVIDSDTGKAGTHYEVTNDRGDNLFTIEVFPNVAKKSYSLPRGRYGNIINIQDIEKIFEDFYREE